MDIAQKLGIDFAHEAFTPDDLARGIDVELEHGTRYPRTNITNDDPEATAKIALAHLWEPREDGRGSHADYYDGLRVSEEAPQNYWRNMHRVAYANVYAIVIVVIVIVIFLMIAPRVTGVVVLAAFAAAFVTSHDAVILKFSGSGNQ